MLIEPRSKASVPLTVVMRTRSNAPDNVLPPEDTIPTVVSPRLIDPTDAQILLEAFNKVRVTDPYQVAAAAFAEDSKSPVVELPVPNIIDAFAPKAFETYPVVKKDPEPICI